VWVSITGVDFDNDHMKGPGADIQTFATHSSHLISSWHI